MVISPSEYIKKCLKIDFDNSVENIIDTGASIVSILLSTDLSEAIILMMMEMRLQNVLFMKMVFLVRNVIVPKTLRLFLWIVWKNVNVLNFPIF